MNPNIEVRVHRSPQADSVYPWKWAIQNVETLEYGAAETETEAKREAMEAREKWIKVLAGTPTQ